MNYPVRETSQQAANQIKKVAGNLRNKVLDYIRKCGTSGAIDEEVQLNLEMNANTERPRRRELEQMKLVKDSGFRRKTRKGRNAIVWVASNIEYPIQDLFAKVGLDPKPRGKVTAADIQNRVSELELNLMRSQRELSKFKNTVLDASYLLKNPEIYDHTELVRRCVMAQEVLEDKS